MFNGRPSMRTCHGQITCITIENAILESTLKPYLLASVTHAWYTKAGYTMWNTEMEISPSFTFSWWTGVAFLFGIGDHKPLIIKNNIFVFQNCRSSFTTFIEVSPKHAFWMQQALLQVSKNFDFSVCFLRAGMKRSHSMPGQDYMADGSWNQCFGYRCFDFLKHNCRTKGCVPQRIDWSALFYWYSCGKSSFSDKTGIYLHGSASCANTLC